MSEGSPAAVTPRLSDHRLPDGRGLLLGERRLGSPGVDGLGVDPGPGAGVQARHDPAVAGAVEQGEREALIPAGLLEWVVADQTHPLEGPPLHALHGHDANGQLVQVARDREYLVEVRIEDRFEARPTFAAGQTAQTRIDPTRSTSQAQDGHDKHHEADGQADDEGCEIRFDERGEVDPMVLLWGRPSLAAARRAPHRKQPRASAAWDAILCRRQTKSGARQRKSQPNPSTEAFHSMAKRARGSTTRPGQRQPLQRQATRPISQVTTVQPRPASLTAQEEARAGELEAAIVAEERQAEDSKRRARTVRATDSGLARSSAPLAVAAAEEYAYVARDVRRIALLGGSMITFLFGLWAITKVTGFGAF